MGLPSRRCRHRIGLGLAVVAAHIVGCSSPPPEPVDPNSRLAAYDAPVIDYLDSLGEDDVGRELEGVLSDPAAASDSEERLLEGAVYRGRVAGLPDTVHVHLVEQDDKWFAYLWVDTAGEPLALPECDPRRVGFRARRLWGPIYTWRSAQPGDGVLVSPCPDPAWREAVPHGR
jgi:hypothetical protein